MAKLKGLKCRECDRHYPAAPVHVCEFCFGPLEVDYQYDALKGVVTRDSIAAGPPSMWRYKDLLPIEGDVAVGHHVGFTPLIRAQNLADELGCKEVWIKNDSVCHPTWSFKDRVVAVAVTKALEFGFDTVACAGGSLITKIWKAIKELKTLGLIDGPVKTKMHAAQALGCGPIVTMIKSDSDVLKPVRPNTIAKSLAIGNPADGYYAYKVAKESGGFGEHATDEEIIEGMLLLARTEGIFTETAGGVTVAATKKLLETGVIPRGDSVVICVTGNGLKTPDALYDRLDAHVKIKPSLSAFDRALADLKNQTS